MSAKETSTIMLSVRLMTYNHADFIEEAMQGIDMQQTNFNFEVVIGDDFSSDQTLSKIKNFQFVNPKLKVNILNRKKGDSYDVLRQEKGRLFNFIDIINNCNGKYIALLDGDDYWTDPLKLQKQVDFLESDKSLIACHHWQTLAIEKEGLFVEEEAPKNGHGYYSEKTATVKNIFSNELRLKSRTLMFRNIIDDNIFPGWFAKVAFGDVPLSFLLGKHGNFGFIDQEMAVYRQTGKGFSTAGLKELGHKKFIVQHFKNWIEIWDYANLHYNYKFHKDATATVFEFYNKIVTNLPFTLGAYFGLLKYNLTERQLPFYKTLPLTFWLLNLIFKVFTKKVIKKL